MSLACYDELYWALRISQQTQQTLGVVQQQVRTFVGSETTRKAQGQHVGIKNMSCLRHSFWRCTGYGQLPGQAPTHVIHKRLSGGDAKLPEPSVGNSTHILRHDFRRPQPTILTACFRPKIVRLCGVPSRHVDSIGHMPYRDFFMRKVRKERLKQMSAHPAMQATHAIHRSAPTYREIGHVE